MKRFALAFIAFAVALLPLRIAEAMPEASVYLACKYTQLEYDRENFVTETKSAYEMQLEYDRNSRTAMEQEISAFSERKPITHEQAVKEIQQMTNSKILPGYILEKGQYTYNPDINSVYIIRNTSIRSQPNKDARVITELYASEDNPNIAENAYNYLGEWISPQGERWVITSAVYYVEDENGEGDTEETATGFLSADDVRAVTNLNVYTAANAVILMRTVSEVWLSEKKELEAQYSQQAQRQIQQAQRQARQSQQAEQPQQQTQYQLPKHQTYYCRRCGKKANRLDGPPPGFGCYPHGAKKPGVHDWTRLD